MGSLLGIVVTVLIVVASGGELVEGWWVYQAAAAMGVTIFFSLLLSLTDATVISTFTVAYLTCLPKIIGETIMTTLDLRVTTIVLGIAVGVLLNFLSSLFRYRDRVQLNLTEVSADLVEVTGSIQEQLQGPGAIRPDEMDSLLDEAPGLRKRLMEVESDLEEVRKSDFRRLRKRIDDRFEHDFKGRANDPTRRSRLFRPQSRSRGAEMFSRRRLDHS